MILLGQLLLSLPASTDVLDFPEVLCEGAPSFLFVPPGVPLALLPALPLMSSAASVPLFQLPTGGIQIAQNKHCAVASGIRSCIMVDKGSATSALDRR